MLSSSGVYARHGCPGLTAASTGCADDCADSETVSMAKATATPARQIRWLVFDFIYDFCLSPWVASQASLQLKAFLKTLPASLPRV